MAKTLASPPLPDMTATFTTHELYRAERNGQRLLRVSAQVPSWAPAPQLPPRWLRWMLAGVLRSWA